MKTPKPILTKQAAQSLDKLICLSKNDFSALKSLIYSDGDWGSDYASLAEYSDDYIVRAVELGYTVV